MRKTYGTRRELNHLVDHLHESESVLNVVAARMNGRAGVAVLTSGRLLFYWHGTVRDREESLHLADLTGATLHKDLNDCVLKTEGASFSWNLDDIDEEDGRDLVDALRDRLAARNDLL